MTIENGTLLDPIGAEIFFVKGSTSFKKQDLKNFLLVDWKLATTGLKYILILDQLYSNI